MKLLGKPRPQLLIVIGMFCIALATGALSRFHSDYLIGLGFGVGIGLLLLGVVRLKRP